MYIHVREEPLEIVKLRLQVACKMTQGTRTGAIGVIKGMNLTGLCKVCMYVRIYVCIRFVSYPCHDSLYRGMHYKLVN